MSEHLIAQTGLKNTTLRDDIIDCAFLSFKIKALKKFQIDTVQALLTGRDALVVQPTASGKSLCYQLPALMLPGTTLVISPLISLMEQQNQSMRSLGLRTGILTAEMNSGSLRQTEQHLKKGLLDIAFVSPERLQSNHFQSLVYTNFIDLIAIDEAHCITTWGQDFRPDYVLINAFLSRFRNRLGKRPAVCALTATADKITRQEISHLLSLDTPHISWEIPRQPNLEFSVAYRQPGLKQVSDLVQKRFWGKRGIIYCPTRLLVERLANRLNKDKISVLPYHAGLTRDVRSGNQNLFETGKIPIMVATLAFGMGIDTPDLDFVLRLGLPASLEALLQEAGRAGRDGREAEILVLFNERDAAWSWSHMYSTDQIPGSLPATFSPQDMQGKRINKLQALFDLLQGRGCIEDILITHFGDNEQKFHIKDSRPALAFNRKNCRCLKCSGTGNEGDEKELLSVFQDMRAQNITDIRSNRLIDVAIGDAKPEIKQLKLNKLKTFGLCKDKTRSRLQLALRTIISDRVLLLDLEHNSVSLPSVSRSAFPVQLACTKI